MVRILTAIYLCLYILPNGIKYIWKNYNNLHFGIWHSLSNGDPGLEITKKKMQLDVGSDPPL